MLNIVLLIILPLGGVTLGWLIRWIYARNQLTSSEQKALRLKETAETDAENVKKIITEVTKPIGNIKIPEARILKIVSSYEGIMFPKLYKKERLSFEESVKKLKTSVKDALTEKFIEML